MCSFEEEDTICGYGVGVFTSYKNLSKLDYISRLIDAIKLLKTDDTKNLMIERLHFLSQDDIKEIEEKCELHVVNGRNENISYIPYVLKELYRFRNQQLNEKEVLIISDDALLTEKIAVDIAKDLRFLTLMSKNIDFIDKLENRILNETGLSLQSITKLDKTVQNFDVIINMSTDVQLDAYNLKRRAIIIDASIGRKLEFLNEKRKDLLIVTDLLFKNSGTLKSNPEVFSFEDKIPSYIHEGIKKQTTKPIKLIVNGKNYRINEVVDIYYGNKRNKSLFLTK